MSDAATAIPRKTAGDLEWARWLEVFAARCGSEPGRALARAAPLARSLADARARAAEGDEALRLAADGEPLPGVTAGDVADALGRAASGSTLAASELRDVTTALREARELRRFLGARRSRVPALHGACATDPTLDGLEDTLTAAFDAEGALADHASPRLGALRAEHRAARERVLRRLEEVMDRYEAVLQERWVTEREGRWVIPVRSDAHERFPGIVHATSNSGATLFVEPRAVVPMGNRLKVLEAEVAREEEAVLAALSATVAERSAGVAEAAERLARADVLGALARTAAEFDLAYPALSDAFEVVLETALHPLLLADGARVVPNDVDVRAGRALVVSGPNAGGKTVALKTVGLAALSARAGLPFPAGPSSRVGFFDQVLTDVGDDQSLSKSLSTFSAHVTNLSAMVEGAGARVLCLLDELASGTDPREGEALAAAVLDALLRRGAAVVVTTHYEALKALALADERFANASSGFDLATMSPTFRLAHGAPGASSALAVARRFGLPEEVLERADAFLRDGDRTFEAEVRRLADERRALELARRAAEDREAEADKRARELAHELEAARDRERRELSEEARAVRAELARVRDDVRDARRRAKDASTSAEALRELERRLDRAASRFALGGDLEPAAEGRGAVAPPAHAAAAAAVAPGRRLYLPKVRGEVEVLELLGDGRARVAAGALKLVVATSELEPARPSGSGGKRDAKKGRGDARRGAEGSAAPVVPTRDTTCDVRGLRADDAVAMTLAFLDRAALEGTGACFVLHGHGTGALRDAVRGALRERRDVRFRPGDTTEGGDGITVVLFA